jgi:predicted Fe-Mo cluster-binding NifX family protein
MLGDVRVCIPCAEPGGPDSAIESPFEEAPILDYYDLNTDGMFEHTARMRNCEGASCIDPVDAITGRRTEAVVVTDISSSNLMRLKNAGVKVYAAENPSVRVTLEDLARGALGELSASDLRQAED